MSVVAWFIIESLVVYLFFIPVLTTIDISNEDSEKISDLSNKIEELDDVQNVYMNSNLS